MSRRFSDEPINVIHRIPSPELLEAARPAKPSFSRMLSEKGRAFVRSAVELFSPPPGLERQPEPQHDIATSRDPLDEETAPLAAESECRPDEPWKAEDAVQGQTQSVVAPFQSAQAPMSPPQPVAAAAGVSHEEEIAELRTFLLRQQQDIVRLAAHVQELKSLVLSQQQVLVRFRKELEAASAPFMGGGVTSAVPPRHRGIRQKPVLKEKATAQTEDSTRLPLHL